MTTMLRPTQTYTVEVVLTDMPCGTCNDGVMEHDGRARVLPGPGEAKSEYRHACSHCAAYEWLPVRYPVLTYKRPTPAELNFDKEPDDAHATGTVPTDDAPAVEDRQGAGAAERLAGPVDDVRTDPPAGGDAQGPGGQRKAVRRRSKE